MKKIKRLRKFTLIEMIAVIAIIAVLMAILLPVVFKMTGRAKDTKAKAEMQAIALAIKSYESTYGILPFSIATEKTVPMNTSEYDDMMGVLTNVGVGNTRQIRFLDVPEGYTSKGYVDPWGNDYNIFLDTSYNGQVNVEGDTKYGTVFIYSTGKGGGTDDYIYSWK